MNIRFMDTSIMLNLLQVPGRCSDSKKVFAEFEVAQEEGDNLILPLATIIETGNHIAHISDGNIRRKIASNFAEFIRLSLENEAPWYFDKCELTTDDLQYIVRNFPQKAMEKVSFGDLSIICQYENFKVNAIAIGKISIWSADAHLQRAEDMTGIVRRRNI